jgi:small subunit ribosomal protein S1
MWDNFLRSQVDLKPVRNPDKLIGQKFAFRVLKYNRRKNNVIVSRRSPRSKGSAQEDYLETIHGALVEGLVKTSPTRGLADRGIDGLVHLTTSHGARSRTLADAQDRRYRYSQDIKYNQEDGKISLGIKQTKRRPVARSWQVPGRMPA